MAITKDANGMVQLDSAQVIRTVADIANDGGLVLKTINIGGTLIPKIYDGIEVVYIVSGNGTGEPGTVTYKLGAVTVATLALVYDSSNRVISVVRT